MPACGGRRFGFTVLVCIGKMEHDFFDHLLDADAASNTLSWRWVAGLQTPGKTYLVRRSNLASYWPDAPSEGLDQLDGEPRLDIPQDSADRSLQATENLPEGPGDSAAGLLLHEEDLSLECGPLSRFHPVSACFGKRPRDPPSVRRG